jgi:metal-responsive CopG/Arc/MetJ family transcriptional regulator
MADIGLPDGLLDEVRKLAEAQERSADEVVREAVERYVESKRLEKLYAYGKERGRRSGIREKGVPDLVEQWRREKPGKRGR